MHFTIVGEISHIETIAKGRGIRSLPQLRAACASSSHAPRGNSCLAALRLLLNMPYSSTQYHLLTATHFAIVLSII
ncbi:MAG TPA: hypothetical protein VGI40_00685 [Pirellulaceae bacterium]|jgi:hypothetical protein